MKMEGTSLNFKILAEVTIQFQRMAEKSSKFEKINAIKKMLETKLHKFQKKSLNL